MLAEKLTPAAHAGEDQASRPLATKSEHWANLAVQLMIAAKALAYDYLQEERDDIRACADVKHHQAVRDLFEAIKNADSAGLSDACAALIAGGAAAGVFWSVTGDDFASDSLQALITANDWLRPGDIVYQAQTVGRYKLTEADIAAAAVANAPVRDPRVPDMFANGGAA